MLMLWPWTTCSCVRIVQQASPPASTLSTPNPRSYSNTPTLILSAQCTCLCSRFY
ncbi:hypothetical protein KC19_2G246500 [Ceratodon purpureus]|uniref:Uncharacterized protein n=1 Tax=Ceratodon purpureus TaxID=3225 RepID=A0A8T0IYR6_CERPU|nr:hypothetical protein KC19_2G246500 [Ceratodon purpureus]